MKRPKIKTQLAPQIGRLNLSYVKNENIVGRNWPNMVEKRQLGRAGRGSYY